MKNKLLITLLFHTFFLPFWQNCGNADFILFRSKSPTSLEARIEVCKETMETLQHNILAVMDNLYENRAYWQQAQFRPIGYYLEKNPKKWFAKKDQHDEIQENLNSINQSLLHNAECLGYVQDMQFKLSVEHLQPNEYEKIIRDLTAKLKPFLDHQRKAVISDFTEYELDALLVSNLKKASNYKKSMLKRLQVIQKPDHFKRNWLAYSIGSVAAFIGLSVYLKNQQSVGAKIDLAKKASNNFIRTYIKNPIKNSIDIIYGKDKTADIQISEQGIAEREQSLREEFFMYYKENTNENETAIKQIAEDAVRDRKLPKDMQERADQESRRIVQNLLFNKWGKIGNILYLKAGILELIANDRLKIVDRLFKTNKLNFELLVALPATAAIACVGYLSYKGAKGLYHTLFSKQKLYFMPLKKALITLESLLNANQHEQSLNYAIQGQLYYWIQKLYQSIKTVPLDQRYEFEQDLQELSCPDFTTTQKLSTLHRMFKAYTFLH